MEQGFILCSNHKSLSDPIILSICTKQKIFFMAKSELFNNHGAVFSFLIRSLGAFPVHRNSADKNSLKEAEHILKQNGIIGIFPQGKIVRHCEHLKIKSGVSLLSLSAQVPVIPTAIVYDGALHPFQKIVVRFGKPIMPPSLPVPAKNTQYKQMTAVICSEMENLLFFK